MADLSPQLLSEFRNQINAAFSIIAKANGLQSLQAGKCRYSNDGSFTFDVDGVAAGGMDANAARYVEKAASRGLPPLGSKFEVRGVAYKTAGVQKRSSKVVAERADGRKFVFRVEDVVRLVAAQAGQGVAP